MQTVNGIQQAKIAIRNGHLTEARRLLRQVVHEEPQNYVAWLLLSRATPSPQASREYVRRAASLQPDSPLVQSELKRLDREPAPRKGILRQSRWHTYILLGSFLALMLLLVIWLAPLGWERVVALRDTQAIPDLTSMPTVTPWSGQNQIVAAATFEPTSQPTPTLQPAPTLKPMLINDVEVLPTTDIQGALAATIEAGENVGEVAMLTASEDGVGSNNTAAQENNDEQIAEAKPGLVEPQHDAEIAEVSDVEEPANTGVDPVPQSSRIRPAGVGPAERWIDVNLNTQTLVAYEGDAPVFNSLISSGMWNTPTVTGQFRTWMKYEAQDMNGYLLGYDYYLEDVPYVMYFYKDFAIHGAYWHNNFGTPMSHGCVNVNPVDAGWLFNWAPVGTTVNIHN